MKATLSALLIAASAGPVLASDACADRTHDGQTYSICTVEAGEDLRLFLTGSDGNPLGTFDRLRDELEVEGKIPVFAMNAGMYHPDRQPVGLYIEESEERAGIVTSAGPGNFGMLPNGVFCIAEDRFQIVESRAYAERPAKCRFATQSGPMLVIDGGLHPRFLPDSESRYTRNGVGIAADGQTAYFAISTQPVSFHEFARLFRDALETPNALYFDGNISRLYAPGLGRDDTGFPMGPIISLVGPAD